MAKRLEHVDGPFVAIEIERVALLEDRRANAHAISVIHDRPDDQPALDEHAVVVDLFWGIYGRCKDGTALWLQDHEELRSAETEAAELARRHCVPLVRGQGVPAPEPPAD